MEDMLSMDKMTAWLVSAHNNECYIYELLRRQESVFMHRECAKKRCSNELSKPVKIATGYATQTMETSSKPGALAMEAFNGGVINKADGMTLVQVLTIYKGTSKHSPKVKQVVDTLTSLYA